MRLLNKKAGNIPGGLRRYPMTKQLPLCSECDNCRERKNCLIVKHYQQIYDADTAELNKEIERLTKELAEEKGYTKELTFFNKLNQDAALASKEGEETK
jgi:hypothetical protein